MSKENPSGGTHPTHRSLLPRDACPSLLFKALFTNSLDDPVHDGRPWPGDGHFWCLRTCTPVGPDDELVGPETCRPGRSCYEGVPRP